MVSEDRELRTDEVISGDLVSTDWGGSIHNSCVHT